MNFIVFLVCGETTDFWLTANSLDNGVDYWLTVVERRFPALFLFPSFVSCLLSTTQHV